MSYKNKQASLLDYTSLLRKLVNKKEKKMQSLLIQKRILQGHISQLTEFVDNGINPIADTYTEIAICNLQLALNEINFQMGVKNE